jgi:acetamidase/formamidase
MKKRNSNPATASHHFLPANSTTVHWGYFSKNLEPRIKVKSGDFVTVETLTHHANDDASLMIQGDEGVESVFKWTETEKGVDRRGAGPMNASIFGRGAGEGFGAHIMTGPIYIEDAEPFDIVEVRILDMYPRASANPEQEGKAFGSNAAACWGYQYNDLLEEPKPREVITIYEIDATGERTWAKAKYSYRWMPQTDPYGVTHDTIDYPGVPVDHSSVTKISDILKDVRVPIRPHFGTMGLAPVEADFVDSIPPNYFGGNIDNWRIGKGGNMYYPVSVAGGLLSIGDPHAAQGDSELAGTAIETSLTGVVQVVLHKAADLPGTIMEGLNYPLLETATEYVVHGFSFSNYLEQLGEGSERDVFEKSSVDGAMRDAFRKMRRFLMTVKGLSEDEAISLMSVAVDFGVTQVVDGNWGVHGIVSKEIFA